MEKPIPNFLGYTVNTEGQVFSTRRGSKNPLVGGTCNGGYWGVLLRRDGKTTRRNVHRLVAMTFLGLPDSDGQVNHIDGNKHNNRLDNLEVCTGSENMKHSVRTGLWTAPTEAHKEVMKRGVGTSLSLFTTAEADEIKRMNKVLGMPCRQISAAYGCNKSTIQRICNGTSRYFKDGRL